MTGNQVSRQSNDLYTGLLFFLENILSEQRLLPSSQENAPMPITLRPSQPADIPFIFAAENHPDNAPYITQCSQAWHAEAIASADYAHFVIERSPSQDGLTQNSPTQEKRPPVGYIILAGIQSPHQSLEIRRIVVVEKGQGYGREILRWIKAFGFEQLGHHRIWLDVLERNSRAQHLYKSEGFVAEGIARESFKTEAGFESAIVMSILASEYSP